MNSSPLRISHIQLLLYFFSKKKERERERERERETTANSNNNIKLSNLQSLLDRVSQDWFPEWLTAFCPGPGPRTLLSPDHRQPFSLSLHHPRPGLRPQKSPERRRRQLGTSSGTSTSTGRAPAASSSGGGSSTDLLLLLLLLQLPLCLHILCTPSARTVWRVRAVCVCPPIASPV